MSAWLLLSTMGFYPVTPGSTQYALGAAHVPHIALQLQRPRPHTLHIVTRGNAAPGRLLRVEVDGQALPTPFITHQQLTTARRITFVFTD